MSSRHAHPLLVPAIAASQFAGPFMVSGVAVALPALGAELHAGATALSLVETLFLAASVALLLPIGRLGDAADKVAIYKTGIVAFALCSILTGLATSMPVLLALRFVQGVASAAVQASGPAIVADAVPPGAAAAPTASPSAPCTPGSRSGRSAPACSSATQAGAR